MAGFGGSVLAMIQSIRYNRNLLKSKNKNKYQHFNQNDIAHRQRALKFKQATPQQIANIKLRLQKENKNHLIKQLIILTLIISLGIYIVVKYVINWLF